MSGVSSSHSSLGACRLWSDLVITRPMYMPTTSPFWNALPALQPFCMHVMSPLT
eukprot:CAMPEP_0202884542 /NCGR_PEP_ID=MMETSP1391-20130828/41114_1 /ASSEMBLY_ACC=CAM_ASM_000867 /TAXON_ID=1034604 /ORGANISM="Chlamydomonas leiostraca, Strain SAG 11-49" /LENGTH=53 /DNA_ID=CAMNT_0049567755 /DNA_START=547 /DNA_END=708 /DNA_ORIENTATION=-